ncbi:Lrp/AsnC family transcriptional regulator [Pedobacter aquatilis]|uniref:Lrp/AsnC family transcriptional regulator n=1 Tax=Pedobacter aquatilis TaxID=351343 RepID=UPI00292DF12A|nr:Lrp/AsnC family transcriptional regulator [Pedobacter aquatilis]
MQDKFDLEILKILQIDNQTSQRDIGDRVGLSAAAVQRRIKRLRADGIIMSDISVVNRELVGNPITILVEVFLNSEEIELIDEVKQTFVSTPEVQQCYYVTGESDFILVIITPSMADYEKLTRRIFFANKNIKRFRTIIAMELGKVGLAFPLNIND